MPRINSETMRMARSAVQRAVSLHLYDPNVSHIDLGLKIRDSQNYRIEDDLRVRVHLHTKLRGDDFKRFAKKYPDRIIDEQTIGFKIDIPEASYNLHQYGWYWWPIRRQNTRNYYYSNTLCGGISISNAWSYGFGTLGGKVIDTQTGDAMLLSNWHVLAGQWHARPGLAIFQPGIGDGGSFQDVVAYYERDAMSEQLDAAVARVSGNRSILNTQLNIGPVAGSGAPQLGQLLTKVGRGSGTTSGMITGVDGHSIMRYDGISRIIKNIVHISQTEGEVSCSGDSGSFWLEQQSKRVLALHFAGSNNPEYALAIDMPAIESALNIKVASS